MLRPGNLLLCVLTALSLPVQSTPLLHFDFEGEDALKDHVQGLMMELKGGAELAGITTGDAVGGHLQGKQALKLPGVDDGIGIIKDPPKVDGDFTIEALVNLGPRPKRPNYVIAMLGDIANPQRFGWQLVVRGGLGASKIPRELHLALSDGTTWQNIPSGFVLEENHDYYIGASISLSTKTATLYRRDLSAGGALEKFETPLKLEKIHSGPKSILVGESLNKQDSSFLGLIDDLRISSGALGEADLLEAARK